MDKVKINTIMKLVANYNKAVLFELDKRDGSDMYQVNGDKVYSRKSVKDVSERTIFNFCLQRYVMLKNINNARRFCTLDLTTEQLAKVREAQKFIVYQIGKFITENNIDISNIKTDDNKKPSYALCSTILHLYDALSENEKSAYKVMECLVIPENGIVE